jgi:hypothetical protein
MEGMDRNIPQDDWKKEMMIPYVIDNQKYKLADILKPSTAFSTRLSKSVLFTW